MKIREASFAIRVVRRQGGNAAIVYRRQLNEKGTERLTRLAALSPQAYSAGTILLRTAVRASQGSSAKLVVGPFLPLDNDWGARVACYALTAAGLRDSERLYSAAANIQHADGVEAAWWLGLMTRSNGNGKRTLRAFRILTEAVA